MTCKHGFDQCGICHTKDRAIWPDLSRLSHIHSTDFETCPIGTMKALEAAMEEIERLKMLVGYYKRDS